MEGEAITSTNVYIQFTSVNIEHERVCLHV